MTRASQALDRIDVTFDDPNLVADAGLFLVATLSQRLGLEALINATLRLVGRVGGSRPGRKVRTLVHAMCSDASHIDHTNKLRAGATSRVLRHRVMAPSTIGTFLRAFTFGHCRQMEAVIGHALQRAWALGAGPGAQPLVIDLDSTICEVDGRAKAGAAYGSHANSAIRRCESGSVEPLSLTPANSGQRVGGSGWLDGAIIKGVDATEGTGAFGHWPCPLSP